MLVESYQMGGKISDIINDIPLLKALKPLGNLTSPPKSFL